MHAWQQDNGSRPTKITKEGVQSGLQLFDLQPPDVVPEPQPADVVPDPQPADIVPEPQPADIVPDLQPAGPQIPDAPSTLDIPDISDTLDQLARPMTSVSNNVDTEAEGTGPDLDTEAAPNKPTTATTEPENAVASAATYKSLWAQAYRQVKDDERYAPLFKKYEKALRKQQNLPQVSDKLEDFAETAKTLLDELPKKQIILHIGHTRVKVRTCIDKVVNALTALNESVGSAISAEPHAALAWSAVMVALPLIKKALEQDEKAIEGFAEISLHQVRYRLVEEEYVLSNSRRKSHNYQSLVMVLEAHLVKAYALAYRYYMKIIIHYTHGTLHQQWDDFVTSQWKTMLDDFKDTDSLITAAVDTLSSSQFGKAMESFKDKIVELSAKMNELKESFEASQVFGQEQANLVSRLPHDDNAPFDSIASKHRTCLDGTQRATLATIQKWIEDKDAPLVLWLHGMAGTGKSSIAQTVATQLHKQMSLTTNKRVDDVYLGSSYFILREDNTRNRLNNLISTVALELTQTFPLLKPYVAEALKNSTTIGQESLPEQMGCFIVDPINELVSDFTRDLPHQTRLVIVIDALDECIDDEQAQVLLRQLTQLEKLQQVHIRILVTSRPESHIKKAMPSGLTQSLPLNKISRVADVAVGAPRHDDISLYLRTELHEITMENNLAPDWISEDTISALAQRADGLFIYAATICRFLRNCTKKTTRTRRLERVLQGTADDNTDSPENTIGRIYRIVLGFPHDNLSTTERKEAHAVLRTILGAVAVAFKPVNATSLSHLICTAGDSSTEAGIIMDRDGILEELEPLRAIVDVPSSETRPLGFFHLSFRDYLLKEGHDFSIDQVATHASLFHACLRILNKELHQDMCKVRRADRSVEVVPKERVQDYISPHLQYACLFWLDHLVKTGEMLSDKSENYTLVYKFLSTNFLFWLEALSWMRKLPSSFATFNSLFAILTTKTELSDLVLDGQHFISKHILMMHEMPLQIYSSALMSSPMKSIIRCTFQSKVAPWLFRAPGIDDEWDPLIIRFTDYGEASATAMSARNATIVRGQKSLGISQLNCLTGQKVLFFQTSQIVRDIAVSPDARLIAFRLKDNTIGLRKQSHEVTTDIPKGETMALSPAGGFLAISRKATLDVWNIDKHKIEFSHVFIQHITKCAFSPDGTKIVVLFEEGGAAVYCVETRHPTLLGPSTEKISAAAFAMDGKKLALGVSGGLQVWDVDTGLLTGRVTLDHTKHGRVLRELAFFPIDERLLVVVAESGQILVCDISFPSTPKIRTSHIITESLVFSPDGYFLALCQHSEVSVMDASLFLKTIEEGRPFLPFLR
ncbi:WD40/YVTN repeat-like-containing domain protein [Niveomyces insectorum RCEF 264]|uniref:WD40/YVTN repeat-like-containing domain protein n=1 Tax=Niveomyces insectorum RCEF 264 TaxID=1081102 RepID=A0A167RWX3_9HYPO|nr:WD40/YVTN repeat-like-containing domain protein [Niveomyces insectorum RCEF 264]